MEDAPIIDRSTVAKNWHARGFSCGVWVDHAGREWKETTLETEELFMVMSGEIELEMEGMRVKISVGEEIHMQSGISYTIRNTGGTTARWLYGRKRTPSAVLQPTESMGSPIPSPCNSFFHYIGCSRRTILLLNILRTPKSCREILIVNLPCFACSDSKIYRFVLP